MSFFRLFILLFVNCVVATRVSYAGITTVQAMSFGEFVVMLNDAQYDVTINTNGTYTFDSASFIEIAAPQEGVYDFDGMTPSTAIASVVVTQVSYLSGIGPGLQMVSLQEAHPGSTDGAGEARITVGGTARTDGGGTGYSSQTLNGSLQIQINF